MSIDEPSERAPWVDLFKFYEEAARTTKATAWTQTAWILSLNAGVLGFAFNLYLQPTKVVDWRALEVFAAAVGAVLCFYLYWSLAEFGVHITNYWRAGDWLAAGYAPLGSLTGHLGERDSEEQTKCDLPLLYKFALWLATHVSSRLGVRGLVRWCAGIRALPRFIRRLQFLAAVFFAGHVGWLAYVTL